MSRDTVHTPKLNADPFFDAMLTLRRPTHKPLPPRSPTHSMSDWEIDSVDLPVNILASATNGSVARDTPADKADMAISMLWGKVRDLERQREEDRHTVLGLTKKLDDQAKALDCRVQDRQTLQNLSKKLRDVESTVNALNDTSGQRKPKKPSLNLDLRDYHTHYDPPNFTRSTAFRSQYNALLIELKDELLDWGHSEFPRAAYGQVNLGKGGRKQLKAEIRDDILSQIYVPVSSRAMDSIVDEVIKRTEKVNSYQLGQEALNRRNDMEDFKTSLKQSIRTLVEESIQPGTALADLAAQVKIAQRVVEDARSTERTAMKVQAAGEDVRKQVDKMKAVKDGMVKMITDSGREVKEIKGDVQNQIKWAKEEVERLEARTTEMRVNLATAVGEWEATIKTTLLELERSREAMESALDPHQSDVNHDLKISQQEHAYEDDAGATINDTSRPFTANVEGLVYPAHSAMDSRAASAADCLMDASFTGDLPPVPVNIRSPFDMIRGILNDLEIDFQRQVASSSDDFSPIVPPSTPATTPPVIAGPLTQPICSLPQAIMPDHSNDLQPADTMGASLACPTSSCHDRSTMDMDGSWLFSPTSQATTTLSDMEAELHQLRLDSEVDKKGAEHDHKSHKSENGAIAAAKPWPAEWPVFWEGGDPTGLGRDRDEREGPQISELTTKKYQD